MDDLVYTLSTSPTVVRCGEIVEDALLIHEYERGMLPQTLVDQCLAGVLRDEQVLVSNGNE